jgi:hypothetical protein
MKRSRGIDEFNELPDIDGFDRASNPVKANRNQDSLALASVAEDYNQAVIASVAKR